jgi:hypothetical protein
MMPHRITPLGMVLNQGIMPHRKASGNHRKASGKNHDVTNQAPYPHRTTMGLSKKASDLQEKCGHALRSRTRQEKKNREKKVLSQLERMRFSDVVCCGHFFQRTTLDQPLVRPVGTTERGTILFR